MFTADQLKAIKFGFNGLLDMNREKTIQEKAAYAKGIGDAMGLLIKIHVTSGNSWQAIVEAAEAIEPSKRGFFNAP